MLQQAFPTNRGRYARSPKYSVSACGLLPRHNDLNKVLSSIEEISLFIACTGTWRRSQKSAEHHGPKSGSKAARRTPKQERSYAKTLPFGRRGYLFTVLCRLRGPWWDFAVSTLPGLPWGHLEDPC